VNTFLHILRFKNIIFWKVTLTRSFQSVVKNVGSFLVFGSFAVGAFFFARVVTGFLLHDVGIGLFLLHRFIGMLLFVFFLTINLGNMVVSFATLYRSPEVSFILTKPVSHLNIFLIKFLDNFFYSSGTLFMVGFSVLLGYGSYFSMPWHFYPFVMFGVLVPFMFLAACFAVLILLLIMRLAERINFRRLIAVLIGIYIIQIYLYFTVTSPVHLANEVMKFYPNVDRYFGNLDPSPTKILPSYWVSEILYFYVTKNVDRVLFYSAVLAGSCLVMLGAVIGAGKYLYFRTWITSLSLKSLFTAGNDRRAGFFGFDRPSRLGPHTEVILKREFWMFFREPSQWLHLAVMLFLSSAASLNFYLSDPMLLAIIYLLVFIFDAFLMTSLTLRFAFPMMSLEGDAFWSIRSSPIQAASVYWIKFLIILIPTIVLGTLLAVLSNVPYLHLPLLGRTTIPGMVFSVAALASLNYGMGAYFANFDEKNPIRIASSQGATLTFLLSIVFLIFLILNYFVPFYTLFRAWAVARPYSPTLFYVVAAANAAVALCIMGISHIIGLHSLKRDF
jgi:ABC-2 type transport system permease protein